MRRKGPILLALLMAMCVTDKPLRAQKPGEQVVVISDQAKARLLRNQTTFDVTLGDVNVVRQVQAGQVTIDTDYGLATIPVNQVKPLSAALDHWMQAIRTRPRDSVLRVARGKTYAALGDAAKAEAEFDLALRLNPKNVSGYYQRGSLRWRQGDFQRANDDFTEAIRLDPNNWSAYFNRAQTWGKLGDTSKHLADLDASIRINAQSPKSFIVRALVRDQRGELVEATADYVQALKLDPQSIDALNNLAWLQATCPDAKVRNGKSAVEHATKLCELDGWDQPSNLDTLAAAYAEAGDFASAVKWQTKVVELSSADEKAGAQRRLDLYRAKKPYREPAP